MTQHLEGGDRSSVVPGAALLRGQTHHGERLRGQLVEQRRRAGRCSSIGSGKRGAPNR